MKEIMINKYEMNVMLGALNVCIDAAKMYLDGFDVCHATVLEVAHAGQIASEKVVLERIVNKIKYDDVRD